MLVMPGLAVRAGSGSRRAGRLRVPSRPRVRAAVGAEREMDRPALGRRGGFLSRFRFGSENPAEISPNCEYAPSFKVTSSPTASGRFPGKTRLSDGSAVQLAM